MTQPLLPNLLLDQSKDHIWMIDLNYQLLYANKSYLSLMKEMTGVEKKLKDSVLTESFGVGFIEKWKAYYNRAFKGEYFEIEEHFYHEVSNQIQYIQVVFEPITGDDHTIFAVACQSKDITRIVKQKSEANQLMDASLDVFCTVNEQWNFVYVSAASEKLWGYSPKELIGTCYRDLTLAEDLPKSDEIIAASFSGVEIKSFVNRYKKKNGDIAYNLWSARWDATTKLWYAVAKDGKELIEQEERILQSEQRFKALVQEGYDMIAIIDAEGNYRYASATSSAILGIPPEDFIGRKALEFIHQDDVEKALAEMQKITTKSRVIMEPVRFKNHKKEWRWMETVLTNMLDNPVVKGIVINSRDITDKIEENHKLKSVSAIANIGYWRLELEGNNLIWTDEIYRIWGREKGSFELNYENFAKTIHPADLQLFEKDQELAFQGVAPLDHIHRIILPGNKIRWVHELGRLVKDEDEKPLVFEGTVQDITKQKEEEQRLKLLESVVTNTTDAVLITEAEPFDQPGPRIIYVNEAFTKMTGYTAAEVIGKTPRILQGPNSDRGELARLSRAIRNWESCELTIINYKKNGEEFWINFSLTPVADEKGWYTHWISIDRDVTEQKTKELENQLLAQISVNFNAQTDYVNAANELCKSVGEFGKFDWVEVWTANLEKSQMQLLSHYVADPVDEKFYEYSHDFNAFRIAEGLAGNVWFEREQIFWDDIDNSNGFVRKEAAKNIGLKAVLGIPLIFNNEVGGILNIGTKHNANYLKKFIQIFKKLEGYIGSELNRKKLENDLTHLFNTIPDILCLSDFKGRFLKMNKAGCELLGYSEEEILYHSFSEFVHPADKNITVSEIDRLERGETTFGFENRYLTKDGNIVWLSWYGHPVIEEGLIYSTAKNITEEKKLRELNRQANCLSKIGSWEVDLVNQKVFWTNEVHQMHETDPESFVPSLETAINFYRADFQQLVQLNIEKCIATGGSFDFEAAVVTATKNEIWVRAIGNAEFVDGECKRIYGSVQDISSLKNTENRLLSLSENLPGVVYQYIIHPDGTDTMEFISGMVEQLWGYTIDEVKGKISLLWDQIELGGDMEEVKASIHKSIQTKSRWTSRFKIVMPNGELKTHLGNSGTPIFLADGRIMFNVIVLDITQQAKNEELLKQASEMARIGSWELDLINLDGDSMYWSPMVREILELDDSYKTSYSGGLELHLGESKERIQKAFDLLIKDGVEVDEELLVLTGKGKERWIRCIGKSEMANNKRTKIYGCFQDIHEQKVAALELEKSLKELKDYKFSLDQSAIIAFTDKKGVITSVNENFCEISEYNSEEIIGQTHQLINSKHHPVAFFNELWKTISSGKVWRGEIKNKTKGGSYYWVDTTIVPFLDENNKPVQYLAIRFDITLRKIAQQDRNSLQASLENSLNEIYLFDAETLQFSYANKGALLNLGYSEQEIKALTPLDIKPDFTVTYFKQLVTPLVNNEKEKIIFFTNHQRKDGSLYPVEIHLQLVAEGNNKRFLAVVLDIRERKKAEENLLQSNERFEKVTEATNDAIWDWDLVNQTFYRSKAIEKFFGEYASKSFSENDFWKDKFHPDDLTNIQDSIKEAIANPLTTRWELEYRVFNELGKTLYVIDRGVIMRNKEGEAFRMVGAMTDISDQKQMTLQLSELNQSLQQYTLELERSNEELEQFAFVASHDLQEPLRMISSFMELLKRKYGNLLDEKGHQYIHFATDGAKRMKQIILDLLKYSRASRLTEGKEDVDLNELVEEFMQLRRKLISEKNATIKSKGLPTLNTHKAAITQIFHCLLDNALKYSLDGTPPIVDIDVAQNETAWEFSIKDNGIGIDPQFYDKIFIIFQRLHNKDEYSGTGIGLSIAKRHVDFLGGRIWLESAPGEGSVFYFSIPKMK